MPRILPAPCQPGAVPNLFSLWSQLVELWLALPPEEGKTKRTHKDIADMLGVPPQSISQWKTGSSKHSPPSWCYMMWLCLDVGVIIVFDPETGARLHRKDYTPATN
jgi:transcriptional regulator with XRE-family HTH domain